jgi:hypothetical protein
MYWLKLFLVKDMDNISRFILHIRGYGIRMFPEKTRQTGVRVALKIPAHTIDD